VHLKVSFEQVNDISMLEVKSIGTSVLRAGDIPLTR
jgi:hypothetical protein